MQASASTDDLSGVARTARDLIRMDTTNWGGGRSNGEREAAEYAGERMAAWGVRTQYHEAAPGRVSVCARVPGRHAELPALVVHGHLDVVPAIGSAWSVDPFAGEVRDGMLWGRGAVDMKNVDAMILHAVSAVLADGGQPRRDLVVTFFADEEDGGALGSAAVVADRPDWFAGASEAISEVGGYSVTVGGRRAYMLQVGEKALLWLRLRAHGRSGHGSGFHPDNAVTRLAEAVAALGRTQWPVRLTPTTRLLLEAYAEMSGTTDAGPDAIADAAGPASGFIRSSLRTTANPTGLQAGYKHNVIPDTAEALVDVRTLPGAEESVLADIRRIVGADIDVTAVTRDIGMEAPFSGGLVDAMIAALGAHDPGAPVVPYLLGAGTDNKALSRLGITGYGFAPLQLPADLDFTGMFHGVDERVPLSALDFGTRVLADLLREY